MSIKRSIVNRSAPRPGTSGSDNARMRRVRPATVDKAGPVEHRGSDRKGKVIPITSAEENFALKKLSSASRSVDSFRRGEFLHVSDLLSKCVRKIALSERFEMAVPPKFLSDSQAITFGMGNVIHDIVKERYRRSAPESMYGNWKCLCGASKTEAPCTYSDIADRTCPRCTTSLDRYVEMELPYRPWLVRGSPDITLRLEHNGQRVMFVIEVKSINHEEWKELARPKPDHVLQVCFYWHLYLELGYEVADSASIIYATKGFVFKSPYKEFSVDPTVKSADIRPYVAEALEFVAFRNGGKLPKRRLCANDKSSDAKECHVSSLCFSNE